MTLRGYLTGLIWLCIAPLLVLSAALAIDHVYDVRTRSDGEAHALLQRVSTAVDEDLRDQITALQVLAASPLSDSPARQAEFYAEAKVFQRIVGSHVILFDAEGQRALFSTRLPHGAPMPDPSLLTGRSVVDASRRSRAPAVSDVIIGPISGVPVVAIAVPALRDDRISFHLLSSTETQRMSRHLAPLHLPEGWTVSLHDSSGARVVHAGAGHAAGGSDTLQFEHPLSAAPWTARLVMPRAAYMAPAISAGAVVGTGLALLTLLGVLGGSIAARRLTRAMQSLVQGATGTARPANLPVIHEVATVQGLLEDALRRREAAEAERRAEEARFRDAMAEASLQLQISETRLRGIFETAGEGIITVDANQTIVMINPAAALIVGHAVDALLGQPLSMLVPERYRARYWRDLHDFGESEGTLVAMAARPPVLALHADGHEVPIEAAISHVHVDGQRLYTVILRDVTERLRNEEQLRSEKAKLDAALQSMTDAVCIADESGRLVQFNDAFVSFHRFASRTAFPTTYQAFLDIVELVDDEDRPLPREQRVLARALRGESATNVEFHLRRRDTGERWIGSYSYAPVRDTAGRVSGAVLVGRDVTAMRQMHAEVLASHAALRRLVMAQDKVQEEERKRVARELHDDLQQTLAAIKMDTLAITQQLPRDPSRVPPMLAKIDELATAAIASTRRIVNDLRPQMLEELGLRPALESLAAEFSQRTGVRCRLELDDDAEDAPLEPAVATCLYRVAQESLNNVNKHAGASEVRIGLECADVGRVRLRVQDDGRGLTPEDRSKRHSFGLVGMGERVRAVGGHLQVHSEPGAGTTVEVEVPVVGESPATGY